MILREINYSHILNHPNLIKFFETQIRSDKNAKEALILMPYFNGGSVTNHIGSISPADIILLIVKIASAIDYMHSLTPSLAHRDIKPDNILYDTNNSNFVLIDFGSVSLADIEIIDYEHALELKNLFDSTTTPHYRAPELFDIHSNTIISSKADVWSFALAVYQIRYGYLPVDGTALSSLQLQLKLPIEQFVTSPERASQFSTFFTNALKIDPSERCSIKEVIEIF
ncbi:hypothetical protein HZS_7763, partial [Henneguya salminicola]